MMALENYILLGDTIVLSLLIGFFIGWIWFEERIK